MSVAISLRGRAACLSRPSGRPWLASMLLALLAAAAVSSLPALAADSSAGHGTTTMSPDASTTGTRTSSSSAQTPPPTLTHVRDPPVSPSSSTTRPPYPFYNDRHEQPTSPNPLAWPAAALGLGTESDELVVCFVLRAEDVRSTRLGIGPAASLADDAPAQQSGGGWADSTTEEDRRRRTTISITPHATLGWSVASDLSSALSASSHTISFPTGVPSDGADSRANLYEASQTAAASPDARSPPLEHREGDALRVVAEGPVDADADAAFLSFQEWKERKMAEEAAKTSHSPVGQARSHGTAQRKDGEGDGRTGSGTERQDAQQEGGRGAGVGSNEPGGDKSGIDGLRPEEVGSKPGLEGRATGDGVAHESVPYTTNSDDASDTLPSPAPGSEPHLPPSEGLSVSQETVPVPQKLHHPSLHRTVADLKDRWNFASDDCAAVVHRSNPSAKFTSSILSEKKDRYMLSPCPEPATPQNPHPEKQFVIVELCDDITIDTIVLANYEFFSRMFKRFRVSASATYPGRKDDWKDLGTFRARNQRGIQVFAIPPTPGFYRYVRIDFLEHYGSEYYCPVSLLRIYGLTHMDDYKRELEEEEQKARLGLEMEMGERVEGSGEEGEGGFETEDLAKVEDGRFADPSQETKESARTADVSPPEIGEDEHAAVLRREETAISLEAVSSGVQTDAGVASAMSTIDRSEAPASSNQAASEASSPVTTSGTSSQTGGSQTGRAASSSSGSLLERGNAITTGMATAIRSDELRERQDFSIRSGASLDSPNNSTQVSHRPTVATTAPSPPESRSATTNGTDMIPSTASAPATSLSLSTTNATSQSRAANGTSAGQIEPSSPNVSSNVAVATTTVSSGSRSVSKSEVGSLSQNSSSTVYRADTTSSLHSGARTPGNGTTDVSMTKDSAGSRASSSPSSASSTGSMASTSIPSPSASGRSAQHASPSVASNRTSHIPSSTPSYHAPPPQPPPPVAAGATSGGESIYRTIMKRLTFLEQNATLSLQYMEEQSRMMRDVFMRLEKRQENRVEEMLKAMEERGRNEIEGLKRRQQQDLQQAFFQLDVHRQQMELERLALLSQVHVLADEVVLEKRLGIAQLILLLALLVFMILTRGSRAAPSFIPYLLSRSGMDRAGAGPTLGSRSTAVPTPATSPVRGRFEGDRSVPHMGTIRDLSPRPPLTGFPPRPLSGGLSPQPSSNEPASARGVASGGRVTHVTHVRSPSTGRATAHPQAHAASAASPRFVGPKGHKHSASFSFGGGGLSNSTRLSKLNPPGQIKIAIANTHTSKSLGAAVRQVIVEDASDGDAGSDEDHLVTPTAIASPPAWPAGVHAHASSKNSRKGGGGRGARAATNDGERSYETPRRLWTSSSSSDSRLGGVVGGARRRRSLVVSPSMSSRVRTDHDRGESEAESQSQSFSDDVHGAVDGDGEDSSAAEAEADALARLTDEAAGEADEAAVEEEMEGSAAALSASASEVESVRSP